MEADLESLSGIGAAETVREAEWLLDNSYIIRGAFSRAAEAMPSAFYARLPALREGRSRGETRVYALARALLGSDDGSLDAVHMQEFLDAYQDRTLLTTAELWALPTFLRLILLERLTRAAAALVARLRGEEPTQPNGVRTPYPGGEVGRVPAAIQGLRLLDVLDWKTFFESVSRVHRTLETDPSGIYVAMDFKTRDRYRRTVEELSRWAHEDEVAVASCAVKLAGEASRDDGVERHVGYYLRADGRRALEARLRCRPPVARRIARGLTRLRLLLYLGGCLALTVLLAIGMAWPVSHPAFLWASALSLLPASAAAAALVNGLALRLVRPRVLPKLDLSTGISDAFRTIVAVPVLLSDEAEIREHMARLELTYLGNADPAVTFAILGDFPDSALQEEKTDTSLLDLAREQIGRLNGRYGEGGRRPFVLVHRARRWNASERRWMGWERKRGKLAELNRLVQALPCAAFVAEGDASALVGARFVVALDADTFVPQGAVRRLVGALGHPLNHARFGRDGRVRSGYTVLQPRIETMPGSARTAFARIQEGDAGLDLYSHAVSDVYQDLFGEGIYAGKGVYEVSSFERALTGRVPENRILSHDLFEGVHGRAGLVSDVVVFEEYPQTLLAGLRRLHRWVRGDWQIARWVLSRVPSADGPPLPNRLSVLDRWKILDNLRRSLFAPSMVLLALIGWLWLPVPAWWTLLLVTLYALPLYMGALPRRAGRGFLVPSGRRTRSVASATARLGVGLVFLPARAATELDAVVRALWRTTVTHRRLLEWVTAAHAGRSIRAETAWRRLLPTSGFAFAIALLLGLARPSALAAAGPVLIAWLLSPWIAARLDRTPDPHVQPLAESDRRQLRLIARRTWSFFEHFVGPDDHWLPPDHFQEHPGGTVARRTSPTNIGLMLLSALAAWDFGYLRASRLLALLQNAFESLTRLQRHRGHLFNWYDTSSLMPLSPRYVSTVDSGNLAACLLALADGCREVASAPLVRAQTPLALADDQRLLEGIVAGGGKRVPQHDALLERMEAEERALVTVQTAPAWRLVLERMARELPTLEQDVLEIVRAGELDRARLADLHAWVVHVRAGVNECLAEQRELLPWHFLSADVGDDADAELQRLWNRVRALPENPRLESIADLAATAASELRAGRETASGASALQLEEACSALDAAACRTRELCEGLARIADSAEAIVAATDFRFLYDQGRQQFHVGFNVSTGQSDPGYYDLLASEARLASYVAIMKGDVPAKHWLHLGRPFRKDGGTVVLVSWAGSMFEYLMPLLFLPFVPGSLLGVASERAVVVQRRFAAGHGTPWGISESAFNNLDANAGYQYRAFGAPGLALSRDAGDRLVIAPYASALGLAIDPLAASMNLNALEALGALGSYGFYEAVDFGNTQRAGARTPTLVRTYMAHHQGMILLALDNALESGPMVRRFLADPRCVAIEPLLYERVPSAVPTTARRLPMTRPKDAGHPEPVVSWRAHAEPGAPQAQVLSNGELSCLLTSTGSGGLRWRGTALTRWRADPTRDRWGQWIYLQDLDSGALWSVGKSPSGRRPDDYMASFGPHRVDIHRTDGDLSIRLAVAISPRSPLEIRRVSVLNTGTRRRRIAVTSFGEVSLAQPPEDRRHPSFQKLFVEASYVPERHALVFRRRGRGGVCLAHAAVPASRQAAPAGWETDRVRFIGREGSLASPEGLHRGPAGCSRSTGATLDPVFALGYEVTVAPGAETVLSYLTAAGETTEEALHHLAQCATPGRVAWAFEQAAERSEHDLHELGFRPGDAPAIQRLFTSLVFPYHGLRSDEPPLDTTPPTRPELWRVGISGDLPVILLRASNAGDTGPVLEVLRAHAYLRRHGAEADLLVLDEEGSGYAQPLRDWLSRTTEEIHGAGWFGRSGGVHYLAGQELGEERRRALQSAASVMLDSGRGTLKDQLAGLRPRAPVLPPFVPIPSSPLQVLPTPPLEPESGLRYENGRGGFSSDGREYVVVLNPGESTPAPWINVIANPDFGFTISESGAGFTWARNSAERRLTPWCNDALLDPPGEVLYLRDEETGEVWSATPSPAPGPAGYRIRHGHGYTTFEHRSHGLSQRFRVFVAPDAPVKIAELEVADLWNRSRRITATYYAELVLGTDRTASAPHVSTRIDRPAGAILARESFSERFAGRVAFLAGSRAVHGATGDRTEFLGQGGLAAPDALGRIGLGEAFGVGLDPCAALQLHIDLPAGGTTSVHFLLGEENDAAAALERVGVLREQAAVKASWDRVQTQWAELLGRVVVRTPEPAMDLMLNRWLPYQTVACRLWARSALYQSSGAFGFRDQLQDALNVLALDPGLTRAQILEAAARQFEEGDVLHWWQPGTTEGVRTRCSDDLLWLPYVTAAYVEATGDAEILACRIPYLDAPPLRAGESQRYQSFPGTAATGTLYEHCARALKHGFTRGPHGLPLIGSGDWNDGLNEVGAEGVGESIWLGWFICATVERFAPLMERLEGRAAAADVRSRADAIRQGLEEHAWDGAWYLRAYYDDGTPLGSAASEEARIDSIAQSWAVLSGAADPDRARTAVRSALQALVREKEGLVLLLDPPFDRTLENPGYIRDYPPGVRENGGQYTHAAAWLAWAVAKLGDGAKAGELFRLLNPISRTSSPEAIAKYRVEPYVVAADVYAGPPYDGRGGWTWYTGSAGWLYRVGTEAILGIRRVPSGIRISPCIPPSWPGFEAELRGADGVLRLKVENPDGVCGGISRVELDGETLDDAVLPLPSDGAVHSAVVRLGEPEVRRSVGA